MSGLDARLPSKNPPPHTHTISTAIAAATSPAVMPAFVPPRVNNVDDNDECDSDS